MTSNNLSIVFAPTLLRCRDNDLIKLLAHSQVANDLIGSFILEYNAKELIKPILGPSGVSIGHNLP